VKIVGGQPNSFHQKLPASHMDDFIEANIARFRFDCQDMRDGRTNMA
jgi:hypothetical protein